MLSMLVLVHVTIVLPLGRYLPWPWVSARTVVAAAATLLALHPFNTAAHYRLFSPKGRSIYAGEAHPYVTDQEYLSLAATVVLVGVVMMFVR